MVKLPIDLEVIEKSQLVKYAEGAVPGVDEPYEVLECSRKLSQDEIQELIYQGRLRITPEGKAEWIPLEKKE
jgi:hypothetical protein